MNDSCIAIERAFKELVMEKLYKSVTVSDICGRAHLSRKSFYANYRNKEDVIAQIFFNDAVKPLRDINTLFSRSQNRDMYQVIYQKIYDRIYADQSFYLALVKPMKGRDDTFIRVATNEIYRFNEDLLASLDRRKDGRKADYIAYFFASSQAMLIQKWVCDGFPYTPEELASLYDEMTQAFWLSSYGG